MSRKFKTSLSEERFLLSDLRPDTPIVPQPASSLSESFNCDTDMSQLLRMRKKRRLPSILLQRRPNQKRNFWPTYRGAVEWLRKREEDLNIALGLLELYPNLIQEAPLDGLWEFLRPLLSQLPFQQTVAKKHGFLNLSHQPETPSENTKPFNPNVPSISVTSPNGKASSPSLSSDSNLVYICGKNKSLINIISNAINPFLFTKTDIGCFNTGDDLSGEIETDIVNSKVFIFVLCKETLLDVLAVKKLRAAILNSISVLYVREADFSLQTPLPDFLFKTPIDEELKLARENSGLLGRARSVSPSIPIRKLGGHHDRRQHLRSPVPKSGPRAQSGRLRKKSTEEKFSNAAVQITKGYRTALTYDLNSYEAFVKSLFDSLTKLVGHELEFLEPVNSESGGNLKVTHLSVTSAPVKSRPAFTHSLQVPGSRKSFGGDDESITVSEYGSYDEGLDHVFDDDLDNVDEWAIPEIDSGTSSPLEKETTYVIFPEAETRSSGDGPRMVKWPPISNGAQLSGRDDDNFNPFFDSPIGFENVNFDIVLDSDSPL